MANYICTTRSNYFRVNDEAGFVEFMDYIRGLEDNVDLWVKNIQTASGPVRYYGFGCYGGIIGFLQNDEDYTDEEFDRAFDKFIEGLQKYVADDDAVLIMESGAEKLRYVTGYVTIVTKDRCATIDMVQQAQHLASEFLEDETWRTVCEY